MFGTIEYTIRPYDTIWMLAQVFNTTVDAIMELNPGIDPRNLYIGQVIKIRPGYQYYPTYTGPTAGMDNTGTTVTPGTMPISPVGGRGTPSPTGGTGTPSPTGGMGTPVTTPSPTGGMGTPGTTPSPTGGTGTPGTPSPAGGMRSPGTTPSPTGGMGTPGSMNPSGIMGYTGTTGPSAGMNGMYDMEGMYNMEGMFDPDLMDQYADMQNLDDLINYFRILWEEHVAWTRMAIMGIIHDLPEAPQMIQRLLRNPSDFANALEPYYDEEAANQFMQLLTDHLTIAADVVRAAKAGDKTAYADADKRWHQNAEDIAKFLASVNPYWNDDDWSAMMNEHLDLLSKNVAQMLAGQYEESVNGFDEIEMQALEMADMMAEGIARQFSLMEQ